MADTKQVKTIGEHHVCAMLARHGWAPALTRDGLERTDILAVRTSGERQTIEVQVKAATGSGPQSNWPLGPKTLTPAANDREWYVMVLIDPNPAGPIRSFVIPRDHVAAAVWISHRNWATEPGIPAGKRNPDNLPRVRVGVFAGYEDRWGLVAAPTTDAPVLLPPTFREFALEERVGLPPEHPWNTVLPSW